MSNDAYHVDAKSSSFPGIMVARMLLNCRAEIVSIGFFLLSRSPGSF